MAYSEGLAKRLRGLLRGKYDFTEKKMFGGLCFMINGNMFCGVLKDNMIVRVGKEAYEDTLAKPNVHPMDFTGRPLRGFVYIEPEGYSTKQLLLKWIDQGIKFASSLPPK